MADSETTTHRLLAGWKSESSRTLIDSTSVFDSDFEREGNTMSGQPLETSSLPPYQRALRLAFVTALIGGLMLAYAAVAEDSKTCDLTIKIVGLETDEGNLIVALINNAEAFDSNSSAVRDESVAVTRGEGLANLRAVPYGTYAIKVFHDENSNGELDTNFVGFPKEPFGFSMDAMGKFGPPTFEQAKFEIASPKFALTINMN